MAKGLFARLTDMLGSGEESDMDETTEPVVAQTGDVRAKDILVAKDGFYGRIFVVSLEDVFDLIGQRSDRLTAGVQLICERVLEEEFGSSGAFCQKSDGAFFFRITDASEDRGWAKAVRIIDKIGVKIFGERYRTDPEQPQIGLAIADAASLMNDRGEIEMDRVREALKAVKGKAHAAVIAGWKRLVHSRANPDDPKWQQLDRTTTRKSGAEWQPMERERTEKVKTPTGSPFWTTRSGEDRRKANESCKGSDRRRGYDRRGDSTGRRFSR